MAASNLKKKDARKAKFDAESDAQSHRNADNKAANAKKVSDLSSANETIMNAQHIANEAEIVDMRRLNGQGSDEHDAWMQRLRTQNKEKMAQMESEGAWQLSGIEQRGRRDKARHEREIAENKATHNADMAAIEAQHQTDLKAARQSRVRNLTRHNRRMAEQSAQHQRETDLKAERQSRERNL